MKSGLFRAEFIHWLLLYHEGVFAAWTEIDYTLIRSCFKKVATLVISSFLFFLSHESYANESYDPTENNWLFSLFIYDGKEIKEGSLQSIPIQQGEDVFAFLYNVGFLPERLESKADFDGDTVICVILKKTPLKKTNSQPDKYIGTCFTPHHNNNSPHIDHPYIQEEGELLSRIVQSRCWDKKNIDNVGLILRYPTDCHSLNLNLGKQKTDNKHEEPFNLYNDVDEKGFLINIRQALASIGASELTHLVPLWKKTHLPLSSDISKYLKYDGDQGVQQLLIPEQTLLVYPVITSSSQADHSPSRTTVQPPQTLDEVRAFLGQSDDPNRIHLSGQVPSESHPHHRQNERPADTTQSATVSGSPVNPPVLQLRMPVLRLRTEPTQSAPEAASTKDNTDNTIEGLVQRAEEFIDSENWNNDIAAELVQLLARVRNDIDNEISQGRRPDIDFMLELRLTDVSDKIKNKGRENSHIRVTNVFSSSNRCLGTGESTLDQLNNFGQELSSISPDIHNYFDRNTQNHFDALKAELTKQRSSLQVQMARTRITELLHHSDNVHFLSRHINIPTIRLLTDRINELFDEVNGCRNPDRQKEIHQQLLAIEILCQQINAHWEDFTSLQQSEKSPDGPVITDLFLQNCVQLPFYINQVAMLLGEKPLNQDRIDEIERLNLQNLLDSTVASSMSEDDYRAVISILEGHTLTPEQTQNVSFSLTDNGRPLTLRGHGRNYIVLCNDGHQVIYQAQHSGGSAEPLGSGSTDVINAVIELAGGLDNVTRQHFIQQTRRTIYHEHTQSHWKYK